ncbi:MAG: alpha/beta hydrolase [Hyphomonadaceae bacterium]|nr:alpha/beta hydrolase [Hyphomonadaceae bacterium]
MPFGAIEHHAGPRGVRLAFQRSAGLGPTIVWLSGYASDMSGAKAEALHAWADGAGRAFLRFDVSGAGRSDGAFTDGTISVWLADALAMIDAVTDGPLLLVGSSMGGWLALLAAQARAARVRGLVLIAPAPDFTERLMWPELTEAARQEITDTGQWLRPSAYGDPVPVTRALIEDGRRHLLLDGPIPFDGPVRILHGQLDPDVPWGHALELCEQLETEDVRVTLIKNGDHRLSTPEHIALLIETVETLARTLGPG